MTPSSRTTWMRCDETSALTTWRRPIVEAQAHVLLAVGAVAERQPVEPGVDADLGAGRVVLAGAPVHAGALGFVGQPRPAALDRRLGGDFQRPLDGGLVGDRRVELDDDRRRDPDGLAVGELKPAVDHLGRRDGGELAIHRDSLAVVADRRSFPGVGRVVAERLGDRVDGAVPVQGARDHLAGGVGQRDVLEPAVAHLDTDRRGRQHLGGLVGRPERHAGLRRRLGLLRLLTRSAEAGGQHVRREDADRKGRQSPAPGNRREAARCIHDSKDTGENDSARARAPTASSRPAPARVSV